MMKEVNLQHYKEGTRTDAYDQEQHHRKDDDEHFLAFLGGGFSALFGRLGIFCHGFPSSGVFLKLVLWLVRQTSQPDRDRVAAALA
jgi:hypothetical protein